MTRAAARRDWPNVFTPATLADWWGCSERQVRKMIDTGTLPAFRLGGKLLRIKPEDVEAFECQTGGSPGSAENGISLGMTPPSLPGDDVIDLVPQFAKRRPASPRLGSPSLRDRQERP